MSVERFVIAGLKVEMDIRGDMLRSRSRKYLAGFDGKPDMVISVRDEQLSILKSRSPSLSDSQCEYICSSAIFYTKLLEFGGFLIHSSALCYKDKAYLFTADSGTGKSTHTGLWVNYLGDAVSIINDDKPAIRFIDGDFFAIGTPWSGKTDSNENIAIPLGGIVLLKRGTVNEIRLSSAHDSVLALFRQTVMPFNEERTDKLSNLLDRLIRTVPIYEFRCDMSEQAVKTSFEALTGEKYVKRT